MHLLYYMLIICFAPTAGSFTSMSDTTVHAVALMQAADLTFNMVHGALECQCMSTVLQAAAQMLACQIQKTEPSWLNLHEVAAFSLTLFLLSGVKLS